MKVSSSECSGSQLSLSEVLKNLIELQELALVQEEEYLELTLRNKELEDKVKWLRGKTNNSDAYPPANTFQKTKVGHLSSAPSLSKSLANIVNRLDSESGKGVSNSLPLARKQRVLKKSIKLIEKSGYYDEEFLKSELYNLGLQVKNPVKFFIEFGADLGLSPSEKFDSVSYLTMNPDVKDSGMNPLLHYIKYGKAEGRLLL
jgi:hypothetical protein